MIHVCSGELTEDGEITSDGRLAAKIWALFDSDVLQTVGTILATVTVGCLSGHKASQCFEI